MIRSWHVVALLGAFLHFPLCEATGQGIPVVFRENFDSTSSSSLPSGWVSSRNRYPLSDDFTLTSSAARSSPNAVISTNATISQSLTSPTIHFGELSPGVVSYAVRRSSSHTGPLIVEVSVDGGGEFPIRLGDTVWATGGTDYTVRNDTLPQHLLDTNEIQIRWRTIAAASGTTGTLRIDDILVSAKPARDLAIVGIEIVPPIAREGEPVSAHIMLANAGTSLIQSAVAIVGRDSDGDSTLDSNEQWGSLPVGQIPEPGESTVAVVPFRAPPPGVYEVLAVIAASEDQYLPNNSSIASFTAGAARHRLVVNEIMYAPSTGEPEWVELHNPGAEAVDIRLWALGDNSAPGGKEIVGTSFIIRGGGFQVLTRDTAALYEFRPAVREKAIEVAGFPSLNNSGDAVILRDHARFAVDSVLYSPSWGGTAGKSVERRDSRPVEIDSLNWGECVDETGATPGAENSIVLLPVDAALDGGMISPGLAGAPVTISVVLRNAGRESLPACRLEVFEDRNEDNCVTTEERILEETRTVALAPGGSEAILLIWEKPSGGNHRLCVRVSCEGDFRSWNDTLWLSAAVGFPRSVAQITEIMHAPRAGDAEYLEIANTSKSPVDLAGWKAGRTGKEFLLATGRTMLPPAARFLLAADSAVLRAHTSCAALEGRVRIAGLSTLQMNNEGDVVVLRDAAGGVIDSVAYSSAWHSPVLAESHGRSLEKINPWLSGTDPRAWGSSAHPSGGTPGCENSIHMESLPSGARLAVAPNPFSPDGDGVEDYASVSFDVPLPTSAVTITVFDSRGRLVRRLANSEPSGSRGSIIWDGLNDRRQRVRIGLYVLLLEVFDESRGRLWAAKAAVAVSGRL